MEQSGNPIEAKNLAAAIDAELHALSVRNTPNERTVRRKYSGQLKQTDPEFILDLARELFRTYGQRWIAYELIQAHKAAFRSLGEAELEEFGRGINSWGTVDAFARTLSGPAWLHGQASDELILKWARSETCGGGGQPWSAQWRGTCALREAQEMCRAPWPYAAFSWPIMRIWW
jgi:3-methyladenine DNA glycosylase AlkD